MISIPRFVGRFLALFALLIAVGGLLDAPRGYAAALEKVSSVASPAVTGWWLEARDGPGGRQLWLRRADRELRFQFSPEKLALGLYPLLSLLLATPAPSWKRRASIVVIGVIAFFTLEILLVLLYPALVQPGAITDIAGTFLGLITFVGGPLILWFVLTFDQLRFVWKFNETAGRGSGRQRR